MSRSSSSSRISRSSSVPWASVPSAASASGSPSPSPSIGAPTPEPTPSRSPRKPEAVFRRALVSPQRDDRRLAGVRPDRGQDVGVVVLEVPPQARDVLREILRVGIGGEQQPVPRVGVLPEVDAEARDPSPERVGFDTLVIGARIGTTSRTHSSPVGVTVAIGSLLVRVALVRSVGFRVAAVGRDRLAGQQRGQVLRRELPTHVEGAELRVLRGGGVEPHLVQQMLDLRRVVGEQRHAPLVIVEADASGDDLIDLAGVLATDPAVGGHVLLALVEGEIVPVVLRLPALVHRVETDVFGVRDRRVDALLHVVPHPRVLDVLDPLDELLVHVPRHLGHGDVGTRSLGELGEGRRLEPALGAVDRFKRRAEMEDHDVGFVADDREDGRPALLGVLEVDVGSEMFDAFRDGPLALAFGRGPPAVPVDPAEIV